MKYIIGLFLFFSALIAIAKKPGAGLRVTTQSHMVTDLTNAHIAFDGNSLTAGYLATLPWPTILRNSLEAAPYYTSGLTFHNFAVSGQNVQSMMADAVSQIDAAYVPGVVNILFVWNINMFSFPEDENINVTVDRWKSYCNARRAAGYKVVSLTCTQRTELVALGIDDTTRVFANKRFRAEWQSFCDLLIDPAADPRFLTINDTYWNADHIHLSDVGYQAIAAMVLNRIITIPIVKIYPNYPMWHPIDVIGFPQYEFKYKKAA